MASPFVSDTSSQEQGELPAGRETSTAAARGALKILSPTCLIIPLGFRSASLLHKNNMRWREGDLQQMGWSWWKSKAQPNSAPVVCRHHSPTGPTTTQSREKHPRCRRRHEASQGIFSLCKLPRLWGCQEKKGTLAWESANLPAPLQHCSCNRFSHPRLESLLRTGI